MKHERWCLCVLPSSASGGARWGLRNAEWRSPTQTRAHSSLRDRVQTTLHGELVATREGGRLGEAERPRSCNPRQKRGGVRASRDRSSQQRTTASAFKTGARREPRAGRVESGVAMDGDWSRYTLYGPVFRAVYKLPHAGRARESTRVPDAGPANPRGRTPCDVGPCPRRRELWGGRGGAPCGPPPHSKKRAM